MKSFIIICSITFCLLILFIPVHSVASWGPGFGNQSTARNLWSVFSNPAGLASVTTLEAGTFYRRTMWLQELATKGLVVVLPVTDQATVAAGFSDFGYSLYKESSLHLALAKKFGNTVQAGLSFDYRNEAFGQEYGSSSLLTVAAGLQLSISKQVRAGLVIRNPAALISRNLSGRSLQTEVNAGIQWQPGDHLSFSVAVSKIKPDREVLTADLVYKPYKQFELTTGVSSGLYLFHFGYAFKIRHCRVGMISGYHFQTGFTPQIALSYHRKS